MLAAAVRFTLLPVGTGTRLGDNVDIVDASGLSADLILAAFREESDGHLLIDRAPCSRFETRRVRLVVDSLLCPDIAGSSSIGRD